MEDTVLLKRLISLSRMRKIIIKSVIMIWTRCLKICSELGATGLFIYVNNFCKCGGIGSNLYFMGAFNLTKAIKIILVSKNFIYYYVLLLSISRFQYRKRWESDRAVSLFSSYTLIFKNKKLDEALDLAMLCVVSISNHCSTAFQ